MPRIKVTWKPQVEGNPGSHFFVQYKKEEETLFLSSDEELNEDSIVIRGLDPDDTYDFRVVAVDGEMQTPSETLSIYTYSQMPATGDMSGAIPDSTIAHAGWFIGMLFAVIVLICVMIAVCFIKMNRGGKYAVQEKEERH